jgi:alkylated DNA repair dioxygenase AlkB
MEGVATTPAHNERPASTRRQAEMKIESMEDDGFVKTLPPAGRFDYRPAWLAGDRADALFATLTAEIDWQRRSIRMFGRDVLQPRLLRFQGEPGIRYSYSGDTLRAAPWHPAVERLRRELERASGEAFNAVLINRYRDGRDSMGWHADDEPELGPDPAVASVSLGAQRRFVLRRRGDPGRRFEVSPGHGSLILMLGDVQHHWQHAVPKTSRAVGERINLTFRRIVHRP